MKRRIYFSEMEIEYKKGRSRIRATIKKSVIGETLSEIMSYTTYNRLIRQLNSEYKECKILSVTPLEYSGLTNYEIELR